MLNLNQVILYYRIVVYAEITINVLYINIIYFSATWILNYSNNGCVEIYYS